MEILYKCDMCGAIRKNKKDFLTCDCCYDEGCIGCILDFNSSFGEKFKLCEVCHPIHIKLKEMK